MNSTGTVLITGASSGIGRDLAHVFASNHYDLILVARDGDELESLSSELHREFLIKTRVEVCDLSDRHKLEVFIEKLNAEKQNVDVLVNNAGFGVEGAFASTHWETERSMIDLNVFAVVRLTKAILPQMLFRNSGKILQISSTAAYQPGPFFSLYFASKSFVLSFSEALASELRGTGVSVTTVCPGPTHTSFARRLGSDSKLFGSGIPIANSMTVARFAYRALMKGKRTAIPGTLNLILTHFSRLIPRAWVLFILVRLLKKDRAPN